MKIWYKFSWKLDRWLVAGTTKAMADHHSAVRGLRQLSLARWQPGMESYGQLGQLGQQQSSGQYGFLGISPTQPIGFH